jgi:hypothetical protein
MKKAAQHNEQAQRTDVRQVGCRNKLLKGSKDKGGCFHFASNIMVWSSHRQGVHSNAGAISVREIGHISRHRFSIHLSDSVLRSHQIAA